MSNQFKILWLFGVLCLIGNGSFLNAAEPHEMSLAHERVIVFKDGYCLVVKEGVVTTDEDGFAYTDEVPDSAILGSFWAVPEASNLKSMVAGWAEKVIDQEKDVSCINTNEIITANVGKHCSFVSGNKPYSGTILKVLNRETNAAPTNRHFQTLTSLDLHTRMTRNRESFRTNVPSSNFFILRSENGDTLFASNSVHSLTIENMISMTKERSHQKEATKRLTFRFDKAETKVKIKLMYFRPDVRWIPTYRIDLTDEDYASNEAGGKAKRKKAKISLQGEILNEAEDFVNVPFHVVVGVPNFRFKSVPSPMVLETRVRSVLAQVQPDLMGTSNQLSNALYTQRSGEFRSQRGMGGGVRAEVQMPEEFTSQASNDLFVYKLDKMSLKKGERATVPILATEVAYRDIYTWDIHVQHAETYVENSGSMSPLVLSENRVWRQIEMINDTDIPWTTGAAMFVDGFQPLAQELLTYTSPGGICRVPITVSVDLRGKVIDRETGRKLKALRWRGSDFAKVSGRIDVELANNKEVDVPVEVRLTFGGKAISASDNGQITLTSYNAEDWKNGGNAINNSSRIKWTGKIKPGECFKPVADYEFWLRY